VAYQGERLDAEGVLVEAGTEVRGKVDISIARGRPLTSAEQAQFETDTDVVRFQTGATRSAENLYDPYGFLNPQVIQIYCEYMERHRVQKDGKTRDSDNWQRGMPSSRAYRSLLRHAFDVWLISCGYRPKSADCVNITDALCAVVFNAMLLLKNWGDENHHEEEK
jgi:hypothetical protein